MATPSSPSHTAIPFHHSLIFVPLVHFQGIIHRDIKPANLMWTSDRRTVKITDFGVAHISAAQRLAGSGKSQSDVRAATTNSDADLQLLFDDSELCKTAGTPSFLAPEVVYDFGIEISPAPSSPDALAAGAGDSNSAVTLPFAWRATTNLRYTASFARRIGTWSRSWAWIASLQRAENMIVLMTSRALKAPRLSSCLSGCLRRI